MKLVRYSVNGQSPRLGLLQRGGRLPEQQPGREHLDQPEDDEHAER